MTSDWSVRLPHSYGKDSWWKKLIKLTIWSSKLSLVCEVPHPLRSSQSNITNTIARQIRVNSRLLLLPTTFTSQEPMISLQLNTLDPLPSLHLTNRLGNRKIIPKRLEHPMRCSRLCLMTLLKVPRKEWGKLGQWFCCSSDFDYSVVLQETIACFLHPSDGEIGRNTGGDHIFRRYRIVSGSNFNGLEEKVMLINHQPFTETWLLHVN